MLLLKTMRPDQTNKGPISTAHPTSKLWLVPLALPYLGLCFPSLYTRTTPVLLGFPFFYWYQFAWVIATSGLLGVIYLKLRRPE